MNVREATQADWPGIWEIFQVVVGAGDTYSYAPDTSESEARRLWFTAPAKTYVAVDDGAIVGTYMLRPNQPGLGAHVSNAGFMVAPGGSGRGVGRAMGAHALEQARLQGYKAMQFNFVVSTNQRAIGLWKSLGFSIVGTVPEAFDHRQKGLVDIHIMHRRL
jgi:L-amino acid N-acyltransferase YncA